MSTRPSSRSWTQIIRNNFSWLLGAHLWNRACLFLVAIGVAHRLGDQALGTFLSVFSFVWFFWWVMDAGLSELVIRNAAGRPETFRPLLSSVLRQKTVLSAAAVAAFLGLGALHPLLRQELPLIFFLGTALLVESYAALFRVIYRIRHRTQWEAGLWALDGALKLAGTAWVLAGQRSPAAVSLYGIGAVWLLSTLLAGCTALWATRRWWRGVGNPLMRLRPQAAGPPLLFQSFPFAAIYLLNLLNLRGMVVLIHLLRGPAESGHFGAAERFLETLCVIPIALGQVMLPASARLKAADPPALKALSRNVLAWTAVAGLLAALGIHRWGEPLLSLLYGKAFHLTGPWVSLLGWLALPVFLKPVIEKVLLGMHAHAFLMRWYFGLAAAALMGSLWAVPRWGLEGAVGCLLAVETIGLTGPLFRIRRGVSHSSP